MPDLALYGTSLIVAELEKEYPNLKFVSYSDIYNDKQKEVKQTFDLNFYNNLI